jgi:hypothetical protein
VQQLCQARSLQRARLAVVELQRLVQMLAWLGLWLVPLPRASPKLVTVVS